MDINEASEIGDIERVKFLLDEEKGGSTSWLIKSKSIKHASKNGHFEVVNLLFPVCHDN